VSRAITWKAVAIAMVTVAGACSSGSDSADKSGTTTTGANTVKSDVVAKADRGEVTIRMAKVGDTGNSSVGVVQTFGIADGTAARLPEGTGIYANCDKAPSDAPSCLTVGKVDYKYDIGEFEVTVEQYVTFLNTVDRKGKNLRQLYFDNMSPTVWPRYGSIAYNADAEAGSHYTVAYPEWADKPFNFGDFRRGAMFANSLTNGDVLSKTEDTVGGFTYDVYKVRLSPETEKGMYDLNSESPKRTASKGFVVPSNDEWIKAAYYDPKGGGTDSYWAYPTGPLDPPNPTVLDPKTGDVTNADDQPLATYNPNDPNSDLDTPGSPAGAAPNWCPEEAGSKCNLLPPDFPPGLDLEKNYMANVSTVGQAKTPSPWGTFDQGGNVVEILDSLAPQPPRINFLRDWHYYHGGVANAPAYQVEISAFGYFPGDVALLRAYPWLGFRIGVVGNPG
jgi:hypothetical protein